LSRRKILYSPSHIPGFLAIELVLDNVVGGGHTLGGAKEADLIEKLRPACLEERESIRIEVGGTGDGLPDLGCDDEAVLFDAGDAGELFDGGWVEAVAEEVGNEGSVLVPEAEAVGENVDDGGSVKGSVLLRRRGRRRAIGLIEVLGLWASGTGVFGDDEVDGWRRVGGGGDDRGRRGSEVERAERWEWVRGEEGGGGGGEGEGEGEGM